MSEIGQRAQVAVSWLGKLKNTAQMVAVILCLALPVRVDLLHPGLWALGLAAALTLWSMWSCLRAAWPHLQPNDL